MASPTKAPAPAPTPASPAPATAAAAGAAPKTAVAKPALPALPARPPSASIAAGLGGARPTPAAASPMSPTPLAGGGGAAAATTPMSPTAGAPPLPATPNRPASASIATTVTSPLPAVPVAVAGAVFKPTDEELHAQACRVYSLVAKLWVDLGDGTISFRKKTMLIPPPSPSPAGAGAPAAGAGAGAGAGATPSAGGGGVAESYSSVRVTMTHAKTREAVVNHTVHPKIELKSNGDRSWTWTIVQKIDATAAPGTPAAAAAATAMAAAAAGKAPEIVDGKQTLTYAFKFKTAELAATFKLKFDDARHFNRDEETKKPKKPPKTPGRPTVAGPSPPTTTTTGTSPPQNAPAPVAVASAIATEAGAAAAAKVLKPSAATVAAAAAVASLPSDPKRPSALALAAKKQSRMLHAATDFSSLSLNLNRPALTKPLDLFSEQRGKTLTEAQRSAITQSRARVTKNFPTRKTVKYLRRRADTVIAPTADNKDLAQLEARIKLLTTLKLLLATDKSAVRSLVQDLTSENTALRDLLALNSAHDRDSVILGTAAAPAPAPTANATPTPTVVGPTSAQLIKPLHTLATANKHAHKLAANVKLTVEGMVRDKQFGALLHRGTASPDEVERQRSKDETHARLIRALGHRAKAPSVAAPGPSALAALQATVAAASVMMASPGSSPVAAAAAANSLQNAAAAAAAAAASNAAAAAAAAAAFNRVKAEILRFKIMKVNRFNRDTPRLLELDVTTKSLTICKKHKGDENGFSNRDIILTNESVVSAEPSASNALALNLVYITLKKASKPGAPPIKQQKTWKILFDTTGERERFFRLLQIHLLHSKPRTVSQTKGGHAVYAPRPLTISRSVESAVRQLPVARLAAEMHATWLSTRHHDGWKYGKVTDDSKQTHASLVPFRDLPPSERDQVLRIVTQTLASVLTLGFVINKPPDQDAGNGGSGGGLGGLGGGGGGLSAGGAAAARDAAKRGTISKDLLSLTEFLAENAHDTWAAYKFGCGWTYGPTKDRSAKQHPHLRAYTDLNPPEVRERARNSAFKVLGTLIDWGYQISKREDALLEAAAGKEADRRITALRSASKSTASAAAAAAAAAKAGGGFGSGGGPLGAIAEDGASPSKK